MNEDNKDHNNVKHAAVKGFVDAEFYDEFRLPYSEAFLQRMVDSLTSITKKRSGRELYDIVELGAGTGIFTRAFLKYLPKETKYLATEPSKTFLEFLKQKVPEVETRMWSAANIHLPDESVKTVVCADCVNWFTDEASLTEICRVLVPGGKLIVTWNVRNKDEAWVQEMHSVLSQYFVHVPHGSLCVWKNDIEDFGRFSFQNEFVVPGQSLTGPMDTIVDHYFTISALASLEANEKTEARRKFETVIKKYFPEDKRQNVSLPFVCTFYCTQKP